MSRTGTGILGQTYSAGSTNTADYLVCLQSVYTDLTLVKIAVMSCAVPQPLRLCSPETNPPTSNFPTSLS